MGKIFFILGKSCSGKDTFFDRLKADEELNLKTVVGYTTRPKRVGEQDGREYFFTNEEELLKLEKAGKVIEKREYNTVYGIWTYFTVDDGQIDLKRGNYLYIGTLDSYRDMRKFYGEEAVVPILIEVENGERLARAISRERKQRKPKYAELCRRFLADETDFSETNIRNMGIIQKFYNDDVENCFQQIKETILERCTFY